MSIQVAVAVAAIVAFASFGQTIAGFGFGLLAVPNLGLVIDPKDAVAVSALLIVFNTGMLAWGERSHIEWDAARTLFVGAIVGLPLGVVILGAISTSVLRLILGIAVLVTVAILVSGFQLSRRRPLLELACGFACGVLTTSLNTNGPPVVLVLQARGLSPESFRPTVSGVLGSASLVGVVLFALAGRLNENVLQACLVAFPAMLVGWRLALKARPRVPAEQFRRLILGLLVAAALLTLSAAVA